MMLSVYSISQIMLQSKNDIATLFVQLIFWRYVKGGGKFECVYILLWVLSEGGTMLGVVCILFQSFFYVQLLYTEIYELCCNCKCWFLQC